MFSFRKIILAHATLFGVFSVACAFAHDLPTMIAMRALQGYFGGVLIPMAFTLVFTKLRKGQQPIGLAMFSLAVTFAPAIGPTIGGYLTENYGWQTIFFVNVIPTAVMVATLAAFGLLLFAHSSFMNTTMSLDYSGDQFWITNIVRAVGQALTLVPLSNVSLGSIAPQDAAAASGISNMMRNLGGAIGTAVLATIVTKREQFHSNIISQSVDLGREEVRNRITELTNYFLSHGVTDRAAAQHQAIAALGNTVKRQALVLGYSDTFMVLGSRDRSWLSHAHHRLVIDGGYRG